MGESPTTDDPPLVSPLKGWTDWIGLGLKDPRTREHQTRRPVHLLSCKQRVVNAALSRLV